MVLWSVVLFLIFTVWNTGRLHALNHDKKFFWLVNFRDLFPYEPIISWQFQTFQSYQSYSKWLTIHLVGFSILTRSKDTAATRRHYPRIFEIAAIRRAWYNFYSFLLVLHRLQFCSPVAWLLLTMALRRVMLLLARHCDTVNARRRAT